MGYFYEQKVKYLLHFSLFSEMLYFGTKPYNKQ